MRRSVGLTTLQVALAFYLIVAGILGLTGSTAGDLKGVMSLLNNPTITNILVITLAVAELIAGVFLIVEFFSGEITLTSIILLIFIILWIINIILIDIIGLINGIKYKHFHILAYLAGFSRHLMILGALLAVKEKTRYK